MMMRVISTAIRLALFILLFAAPADAGQPMPSGTVTGEMRLGDQVIPLTHVYVMEPFVLPDAPPDPEVARRLIVILADRPYPGVLPLVELAHVLSARQLPFNGMSLEIDRATGQVLLAQPSLVPRATPTFFLPNRSSILTEGFKIAGGRASARIGTFQGLVPRAFPINSPVTVTRGTASSVYDKKTPALFTMRKADGFDARFTAPILPPPRLQRTLIGNQARTSAIATAYAAIQSSNLQTLLTDSGRQVLTLEPGAQHVFRRFMAESGPPFATLGVAFPQLARLEEILLYENRALLRFRPENVTQDRARAFGKATPGIAASEFHVRARDLDDNSDLYRLFTPITVIRPEVPKQPVKPWTYFGQSMLPLAGLERAADIHMILDNGVWRLARN